MGAMWVSGYKVGMCSKWDIVPGSMYVSYGLSGYGLGVGRPGVFHMGYISLPPYFEWC